MGLRTEFIINHKYLVRRYPKISSPIYEIVVLQLTKKYVKVQHEPSSIIEWNQISDFEILEDLGVI